MTHSLSDYAKELKEVIDAYVDKMEGVNHKRMHYAEAELKLIEQEARAFNLLRQQLYDMSIGIHPMHIIRRPSRPDEQDD